MIKKSPLSAVLLSSLLILVACSSGGHMNLHSFNDIELNESPSQVVSTVGEPFAVYHKGDGIVVYEYIERIKAGGRDIDDRHYIITFKDGKVISKDVKFSSPPAYTYDSYEMQTSQRNQPPPSSE